MTKLPIIENNQILTFIRPLVHLEESIFSIDVNNSIVLDSYSDNNYNINNIINKNKIDFFSFSLNNKEINDNSRITIQTSNNNNNDILINDNNKYTDIENITLKTKILRKGRIFRITKDNKNLGRIKKNTNYIGKHNKFSEDNIIRKLKGRFHEKCRIYINKEYKRYLLNNKHDIKKVNDLLQRISPKISRKIKKEANLKWLKLKLYNVFSENVSEKCSLYAPEHNKKEIERLFKENEAKNVIDILNKPVKLMFEAFVNNINIPGFETLDSDINELEEKMRKDGQDNIKEYLIKYRKVAHNFESIFIKKSSRNNK